MPSGLRSEAGRSCYWLCERVSANLVDRQSSDGTGYGSRVLACEMNQKGITHGESNSFRRTDGFHDQDSI